MQNSIQPRIWLATLLLLLASDPAAGLSLIPLSNELSDLHRCRYALLADSTSADSVTSQRENLSWGEVSMAETLAGDDARSDSPKEVSCAPRLDEFAWTPGAILGAVALWTIFLVSGPYVIGQGPLGTGHAGEQRAHFNSGCSHRLHHSSTHRLSDMQASRVMQLALLAMALDHRGISASQLDAVLLDLAPGFDKYRRALVDFVALGFVDRLGAQAAAGHPSQALVAEFSSLSGLQVKLARWAAMAWCRAFAEASKTLALKG